MLGRLQGASFLVSVISRAVFTLPKALVIQIHPQSFFCHTFICAWAGKLRIIQNLFMERRSPVRQVCTRFEIKILQLHCCVFHFYLWHLQSYQVGRNLEAKAVCMLLRSFPSHSSVIRKRLSLERKKDKIKFNHANPSSSFWPSWHPLGFHSWSLVTAV